MEDFKNNSEKKNKLEIKELKNVWSLKINGKKFNRIFAYSISVTADDWGTLIFEVQLDVKSVKDLIKEKGVLILDDTEIYDVVSLHSLKYRDDGFIEVAFKIKVDEDNAIIHFDRNEISENGIYLSKKELLTKHFRQLSDKLDKAYEKNDIERIEKLLTMLLSTYATLVNA